VVKNSVMACCPGEARLVASTTASMPSGASARSSPLTTSTPAEREIATTSRPLLFEHLDDVAADPAGRPRDRGLSAWPHL